VGAGAINGFLETVRGELALGRGRLDEPVQHLKRGVDQSRSRPERSEKGGAARGPLPPANRPVYGATPSSKMNTFAEENGYRA